MAEKSEKNRKKANRHRFRQLVVQFLYMWDASKDSDRELLLDIFFESLLVVDF